MVCWYGLGVLIWGMIWARCADMRDDMAGVCDMGGVCWYEPISHTPPISSLISAHLAHIIPHISTSKPYHPSYQHTQAISAHHLIFFTLIPQALNVKEWYYYVCNIRVTNLSSFQLRKYPSYQDYQAIHKLKFSDLFYKVLVENHRTKTVHNTVKDGFIMDHQPTNCYQKMLPRSKTVLKAFAPVYWHFNPVSCSSIRNRLKGVFLPNKSL